MMNVYRCDMCHAIRLLTEEEETRLEVPEWVCGSGRLMDLAYCTGTVTRFATLNAETVDHA